LLAGSILSAVVLTGCNNNDDQNPPAPAVDNNLNDHDNLNNNRLNDNKNRLNDNKNRLNDNINDNINNKLYDNNNDLNNNNNHYSPAEDKNTDTDKDLIKDRNTKQEDIIEDDIDMNDKDNKDE